MDRKPITNGDYLYVTVTRVGNPLGVLVIERSSPRALYQTLEQLVPEFQPTQMQFLAEEFSETDAGMDPAIIVLRLTNLERFIPAEEAVELFGPQALSAAWELN